MAKVLVLYYSRQGATAALARRIADGVEQTDQAQLCLRSVPPVRASFEPASGSAVPDQGPPYVNKQDLIDCDGLILGSPTRFGAIAAPLKLFLESTSDLWVSGAMVGKPAAAFTATASLHGGQESTLLGMLLPLLHHGMLVTGLPYTESALNQTESGGTPYGASRWTGVDGQRAITGDERDLARALGRRVARLAVRLAGERT